MQKHHLPERIAAERCELRRHTPDLADLMFRYVDQDRKRLREFLPWVDSTCSVADELAYIEMTERLWQEYKMFDYGLFRREDDRYLGNVGVHTIIWEHARCELGYWILQDFEGMGYVSEAVRALECAVFELGFNRIEIRCSSRNLRSSRVPERNRYLLEGVLRQHMFEQDAFRDTHVYAKLRQEQND